MVYLLSRKDYLYKLLILFPIDGTFLLALSSRKAQTIRKANLS